jgi:hypothetical protein
MFLSLEIQAKWKSFAGASFGGKMCGALSNDAVKADCMLGNNEGTLLMPFSLSRSKLWDTILTLCSLMSN